MQIHQQRNFFLDFNGKQRRLQLALQTTILAAKLLGFLVCSARRLRLWRATPGCSQSPVTTLLAPFRYR